jgi:hypothetical protein
MKNAAHYVIRSIGLLHSQLLETHWPAFITLTYADVGDKTYASGEAWQPKHISQFIDTVRKHIQRHPKVNNKSEKVVTVWTCEKNKHRDYVHYHLVIWVPKQIKKLPKPDKQGWWRHGWTNIQCAYNPAVYLAKYLSKDLSNEFCNFKGVRRYAVNTCKLLCLDYIKIPSWLSYYCSYGDNIKRVTGIGWVNFTRRTVHASPYVFYKSFGLRLGNHFTRSESVRPYHNIIALDEMTLWKIQTNQSYDVWSVA